MTKTSQLQTKAATLPEHLAAEVLDFLEFVTARHAEVQPPQNSNPVTRFQGTFKGRLSSTAAFSDRKSDEIRLEE